MLNGKVGSWRGWKKFLAEFALAEGAAAPEQVVHEACRFFVLKAIFERDRHASTLCPPPKVGTCLRWPLLPTGRG